MSCIPQSVGVILLIAVDIGLGLRSFVEFKKFCSTRAAVEGRLDEYSDPAWVDDTGMNAFSKEQYWYVLQGAYRKHPDKNVRTTGEAARRWMILAYGLLPFVIGAISGLARSC